MKILFVTSTLTSGGAERVISLLADRFAERGHKVEMLALTSISPDFYQLSPKVRFLHADKECGGGLAKELLWVRRHVRDERPDVVVAFMEAVYEFMLLALLGTGTPVISSERKDPTTLGLLRRLLRWILLPTAAAHVVQTQKIKDFYNAVVRRKTHIIYNPVNEHALDTFSYERLHRIVSVGRLYPQKNQRMLIEAFCRVMNKYPEWQLVIYGEGHLRPELERLVKERGAEGRVLLPGKTPTVIDEVARSEVFCLSSNFEGMSNAMIEAMCVGTPVISTRVSGTDELIEDGHNGILVDIGDTEGLANAFDRMLGSPALRRQMADRSRELAHKFKTDSIVDQWQILMQHVFSKS